MVSVWPAAGVGHDASGEASWASRRGRRNAQRLFGAAGKASASASCSCHLSRPRPGRTMRLYLCIPVPVGLPHSHALCGFERLVSVSV